VNATLYRVAADAAVRDAAAVAHARAGATARLELGDAWAGIHVVLTSEPPVSREQARGLGVSWDDGALENVLLGGEPLAARTAFGPITRHAPDAVARWAAALADWPDAEFRDAYDADYLDECGTPPGDWDDTRVDALTAAFARLRAFYAAAAAAHDAILIVIHSDSDDA
jgi:Domain of unknown function (DUF1877)